MPPRDKLPEGTDHIINGAMSTGTGTGTATGTGTGTGSGANTSGTTAGAATAGGGGSGSGFIGGASQDGTGGTAAGGGTMATNDTTGSSAATTSGDGGGTIGSGTRSGGGTGGGGNDGSGVVDQLKSQATALRDQAGGRVRGFAESGKTRASDALEELAKVVGDTAESIDERMGNEYGEYARRAADAVSGVADTLRRKEVDELYDNVRSAVRKSPGVAIGVAAVLGFTVARLIKSGLEADGNESSGGGKSARSGKSGGSGGQA